MSPDGFGSSALSPASFSSFFIHYRSDTELSGCICPVFPMQKLNFFEAGETACKHYETGQL